MNWSKIKIYKVLQLGQYDEKGEQFENQEFWKNVLLLVVRSFVAGPAWWGGGEVKKQNL